MTARQQVWWEAWKVGYDTLLGLANKGGNVTGIKPEAIADEALELFDKRWPIEALKEAAEKQHINFGSKLPTE